MDQVALVESEIEDGRKFIERLVREGEDVRAAGWVKTVDDGSWVLYLALPGVDKKGSQKTYLRIFPLLRSMSPPSLVDWKAIRAIDANDPIAVAMADYQRRYSGKGVLRYPGDRLGDTYIEGAYIYPAVTTAASPPPE